ncbi:MAG: hypothetical protein JKZ03_07930 [Flavobacteriaceae bacterium]|nr:hypothetical protein [Flavobacteriaceae bacterium]
MKKIVLTLIGLFILTIATKASEKTVANTITTYKDYAHSFTFVVSDVEFSVFQDGRFDFVHLGHQSSSGLYINTPIINISFNSGYNYDAYVQYDDYGAIIQIEDVPIYYDYYGRISKAGNISIKYHHNRISRIGSLYAYYDHHGNYSHHSGYINYTNRHYVYRSWHSNYIIPLASHCVVYQKPYRRYYSPIRYSYTSHRRYYKPDHHYSYSNSRRDFYRPGSRTHHLKGNTALKKDYRAGRRTSQRISRNDKSYLSKRNSSDGIRTIERRSNNASRDLASRKRAITRNESKLYSSKRTVSSPRSNTVRKRSVNNFNKERLNRSKRSITNRSQTKTYRSKSTKPLTKRSSSKSKNRSSHARGRLNKL